MTFTDSLIFEDTTHRLELRRFGVAHTRGDGFAWSPNEKILFTGDACVNGPHNNVNNGDVGAWIETLRALQKPGTAIACPGHGPIGGPEVIEDHVNYFIALRAQVKPLFEPGKSPAEVKAAVEAIGVALKKNERIAHCVGGGLSAHARKVYAEFGGQPFLK